MFNRFTKFATIFGRIRKLSPTGLSVPWFRDRSIGLKIGVGFGIILLFFLSAGATTYLALQSASDGFVEYRTISRSTDLLAKIQTDLLDIRDTVKDYLITGSEDALKSYDDHITATRARLASTKAELNDPERIARLADVGAKLARYDEAFGQIVALRKKRSHLVDDVIYVNGPLMSEKLNDLFQRYQGTGKADVLYQLGNALKYLDTGRLYASRFLDTGDATHADAADSELFLFEDYLYALDSILDGYSLTVLADIKQSLELFKNALTQSVETVQAQNLLAAEIIEKIGPDVAATVGDLTDSIRVRQDSLGPKLMARNAAANALVAGLLVAALLMGTLIALYLARTISLPLRRATRVMESIRLGRLDQRVGLTQKDEVGRLSSAIDDFADSLAAFSDLLRRMGQGDFSMLAPLQSPDDEIGKAARQMVDGVRALAMGARSAAEQVDAGAGEMLDSSQSLSQAATQQAASVEEITSTMQLIGTQARTNADKAAQAHALGQESELAAQSSVREMDGLVLAMQELDQSSKNIAKIIKTIDEIAFQTNILALNAAVEAARAGKHGRGFAVVANEVRSLASRSAKAAEETESLIAAALGKVSLGMQQAHRTAGFLNEIEEMGHRSALLVGEIAAASEEQARGASEVGIALDQVQSVTQDNTAQAEEVAAAATELSSQSRTLRRLINRFRIGDRKIGRSVSDKEPHPEPGAAAITAPYAEPNAAPNTGQNTAPTALPGQVEPLPELPAAVAGEMAAELPAASFESVERPGTFEAPVAPITPIAPDNGTTNGTPGGTPDGLQTEIPAGMLAEIMATVHETEFAEEGNRSAASEDHSADAEEMSTAAADTNENVDAEAEPPGTDSGPDAPPENQPGKQQDNLPAYPESEMILPEQVIALDDEEFGRY